MLLSTAAHLRAVQAFFAAFDLPWMQGHWFSEEQLPGHK